MGVVILALVVIAALFVIISGVWVALALITAISERRAMPGLRQAPDCDCRGQDFDELSRAAQSSRTQCRADDQSSD